MKVCPNCGREVDTKFCPDCGTMAGTEAEIVEDVVFEVIEEDAPEGVEESEDTETPEEAAYEVRQEIVPVPNTQRTYTCQEETKAGKISAKSTAIVAYIGWIGLIIAFILGDREGAKFHLNQSLVINLSFIIISLAGPLVPILAGLVVFAGNLFTFVCWGVGLYYAITQQEKEVPLLGQIKLL